MASNVVRSRVMQLNFNQMHPAATCTITTQRGSVYRIRKDPDQQKGRVDPAKINLLVSMDGHGSEVPQRAHAVVEKGKEWEIHPGHLTSPITAIVMS